MSLLEIWNNPLHPMEFRLGVAVAEIESLRQRVAELEDQVTEVPQIMRKLAACEQERDEYACMSFASSLIDCKGKLNACEKERDGLRQRVADLEAKLNCSSCKNNGNTRGVCQNDTCVYEPMNNNG